jgi:fermentation-respiration switch protein FrsA (DUF1100 family)
MKRYRGIFAAFVFVVALVAAPSAQAAFGTVYGGTITCTPQAGNGNIRACSGHTHTFDGTRIDVNVFLPPETGGTEGPYPLIGDFHGWGGSKQGLTTVEPSAGLTFQQKDARIQGWAEEGYAVFSMSDRGWGESCGKYDSKKAEPECAKGYNHLMDDRYEVRDAQFLIGELAEEGIAEPKKIGATGASYGGGLSIALASLRNREMLPNGELVPWETEGGEEMEIAAAVPQWPWTDLSYALAPNGRNLDYVTNSTYKGPSGNFPVGVMKYSWVEGLNTAGEALSNYSKTDPEAAIGAWLLRLKAGEPYTDEGILGIISMLSTFHSSFGIDHSVEPSPLLIQSGWNDDLFPVDESLRYYQRTRAQYPGDPISLYLADIGHARSQNKAADVAAFNERLETWFAYYLKGEGTAPSSSVEAKTTTCPSSEPSGGPYKAADWSALSPGEIRFQSAATQAIVPSAHPESLTESSAAFDPLVNSTGKGACAQVKGEDQSGVVNYRLAAAPAGGFTLMGSPTITATVESPSPNSEIAARLVDVNPEGKESLIARGLYRPVGGSQEIVFQLHPQGYHFAEGDVPKLELLPTDFPYGRFSNLQNTVTVSNLELRLPVMEQPGSLGGLVQTPAAKVVPAGYQLAAEYQQKEETGGNTGGGGSGSGGGSSQTPPPATTVKVGAGGLGGKITVKNGKLMLPLSCSSDGACSGKATVTAQPKGKKNSIKLASGSYSIAAGKTTTLRLPLTKAGRNLIASLTAKSVPGALKLEDKGRPTTLMLKRAVQLPRGK